VIFFIYRAYSWRTWVTTILGFLSIYAFLFTYYFWTEQFYYNGLLYLQTIDELQVYSHVLQLAPWWIFTIILGFIFFITYHFIGHSSDKIIKIRTYNNLLIWLFYFTLASYFFISEPISYHLTTMFVPLAILMSPWLLKTKKKLIPELFISILLLITIAFKLLY